ncbi:hypothetical protein BC936DRAFT_139980 [Jimgerdemannia flammicorona]|uniref:Uncharacterized protein n=1 Tax=Jimgerdemannia flammicorona TaxID=994334 RepID=A0A433B901_9FUNG|nr:hypothetical protein BC936DRAFT_139980 [Jimgerdemannia flammicorona]
MPTPDSGASQRLWDNMEQHDGPCWPFFSEVSFRYWSSAWIRQIDVYCVVWNFGDSFVFLIACYAGFLLLGRRITFILKWWVVRWCQPRGIFVGGLDMSCPFLWHCCVSI